MNNRKPWFVTSDWHLGHQNCLNFDSRPFKDLDHMHKVLINNYNSNIPSNGICFFLGDMGMHNMAIVGEIVTKLNGTKVLVLGNHDKNANAMYNLGFDVVLNSATIFLANHKITMSHCPLKGVLREDITEMKGVKQGDNWHGEYKNSRFSVENEGQFHLHGHIHSPNGGRSVRELGRQFDVGVVANKYTPVSMGSIESWVSRTIKKEINESRKKI